MVLSLVLSYVVRGQQKENWESCPVMPTVLLAQKELFAHRISNMNEVTYVPQYLPACVLKYVIK